MDAGAIAILALAGVLVLLPAPLDRWALRRGASPETLIALATITLTGIAAVPVAFLICTSHPAGGHASSPADSVIAVTGVLLVANAAGRALGRAFAIRRRWRALASIAAALEPTDERADVKLLPVNAPLAFASGTQAFVSQGLVDRLGPAERLAVIEHERQHAQHHHGRLLAAARALTYATFNLAPARRASQVIDRELDVLADQAAAQRLHNPGAVQNALLAITTDATIQLSRDQHTLQRRLGRLDPSRRSQSAIADHAVGLATLAIGTGILLAICLSIHSTSIWLGIAACTLLIAGIYTFTRPVLITARATSPAMPTGTACRQPAAPQAGGRDNAAPARARSHALSPRHR